jgi:glycosyltransferase involved in cell wall biosynthesis
MKVLQAPRVIANQSVILTEALRRLGTEATSLQYCDRPKIYSADIDIDVQVRNWYQFFKSPLVKLINFPRFLNFDVFHFHNDRSLLPFLLDLPILKILGKKIVFEFHGSDIRPPFSFSRPGSFLRKSAILIKQRISKTIIGIFADAKVVTTPDLLEYVPSAHFIPVAIDKKFVESRPRPFGKSQLVIIHAPTNRVVKGSDFVISAVKNLQSKGLPVRLDLIEGLPPAQLKKHFEKADVAVDQLLIGWYGLFAVEMMALGVPVVSYLRDDLKKYAPNLPIVSANPDNLVEVLEKLVSKQGLREKLGRRGPGFVREFHQSEVVAKRFIDLYKKL